MKLRISGYLALFLLSLGIFAGVASNVYAEKSASYAQTIWRLLDYIAVDYPAAVENGQVISDLEFAEMTEFSDTVANGMVDLPPTAAQSDLITQANALRQIIANKAAVSDVAGAAHSLANALITAYPVPLAPATLPDLTRGKALYAETCASCHGISGQGNGPEAQGMQPSPINFTDQVRANKRSIFSLYQVISQGLDGTAMQSYAALPPQDRWALAFYVGDLSFSQDDVRKGQQLWQSDQSVHKAFSNLTAITQTTVNVLSQTYGKTNATALMAYLRNNPQTVNSSTGTLLSLAKERLSQTLEAYRNGERQRATKLALSSYLDGFEPIEPVLRVKDSALMRSVETSMIEMRGLIGKNAPVSDVEAKIQDVRILLDNVEIRLATSKTGNGASFIAAFTILLREGVEALLIVVAMLAFLNKADRTKEVRFVHAGWVVALIAGVLTWAAASTFISISGASRELTEGIGALLAAAVLVFVGIWMQGKSQAAAWQKYIRDKMSHALSRQSAGVLFLLAFVVVYREVFEVILFLIALWNQGNAIAILSGLGSAIAALGVIAVVLMNYSKRLPITQFFLYSSFLMAILAVVLAGKGIAALQEAGWVGITQSAWLPRVEIIGMYPTWQGLVGQALVLTTLLIAFWMNNRKYQTA
ncbi:MAG: iron permease [Robiginitomaculum sp.]|nr:MAG: iron permease [Robiginitomaculum sp.]